MTGTESLVDIQVRSQRNPHKTLLCSSTPRVLVQPGYPTRGRVGLSVRPRRSVSGDFRGAFRAFLGAFGFSWWAFAGTFAAPSAPSPVWVVVGRSLWSACRAVPLLCLSACLRFALCVSCGACGACARFVALVLCGPWAVVLLGLCAFPLWVFGFRVFRQFSGDAGRTIKIPSSAAQIARVTTTWIFLIPHGDALISQLFLLMSAFCRFLRNLQKFAYNNTQYDMSGIQWVTFTPIQLTPLVVWSLLSRPSSVLIRSTRTLSPLLVSGHPLPFKSDTKAKLDATISSAIASWHHRIPEAPRGS